MDEIDKLTRERLQREAERLIKSGKMPSLEGHMIRIAKVPNFTPLQVTILGWEAENIEAVVAWLTRQGVTPEKYPFVQDRELGIWTTPNGDKVAWFKDPDGNILSVSQHH